MDIGTRPEWRERITKHKKVLGLGIKAPSSARAAKDTPRPGTRVAGKHTSRAGRSLRCPAPRRVRAAPPRPPPGLLGDAAAKMAPAAAKAA